VQNVFILKTNSDSQDFQNKLSKFLSKYCKETDSNAAVFELNEPGKQQVKAIITD
jgi:hypothetical protein